MTTSAKKAITRGLAGAALVATFGFGAVACSSDDDPDDDTETPTDDVEESPDGGEEAPDTTLDGG